MTEVRPGIAPAAPGAPLPPYNALAIIGFVLAFLVPPGAIACGHIALGQIRRTGEQGYGLALAAAILGWVFTAFLVLFVVLWFAVFASVLIGWLAFLPVVAGGMRS